MNSEYVLEHITVALDSSSKTLLSLDSNRIKTSKCSSIRAILHKCSRSALVVLTGIVVINIIGSVIPIMYFVQISDAIQTIGDYYYNHELYYERTMVICYWMFGYGVGYTLITWLATLFIINFSRKQGVLWRKSYFKSLLKKKPEFYDLHPEITTGNNINSECAVIEESLGEDLMLLIAGSALLVSMWVMSLIYSIELTLISAVIFPVQYISVSFVNNKKSANGFMKMLKMYSLAGLKSEETFENIKTISSLNCQEKRIEEYTSLLKPLKKENEKEGAIAGIGWGLNFSIVFAIMGVMFYATTVYIVDQKSTWAQGKMKIADMIIVFYTFLIGSILIGTFRPSLKKIGNGMRIAKNVQIMITDRQKQSGMMKFDEQPWKIKFKNVKFTYPSKPDITILRGLSLKLTPGQKIGTGGTTGCGKSTIAQLLLRLYSVTSGTIKINGQPIENYDIKS